VLSFPPGRTTVSNDSLALSEVLKQHAIELPAQQVTQLARYCELLWDWNTKINLTRHTSYEKFVTRDLLDSLAFAEFLRPDETVLDVGAGGGVPGVVLAIVRPDLKVTLSDSVGKKARVLSDIVSKLALPTAVFQGRAQDFLRETRQDTLVIRAVARLAKLLEWFEPLWDRFERMLVLKGPAWVDERGEARHLGRMKRVALRRIKSYRTPGTDAESVLLELRRKKAGEAERDDEEA
jgi:16S rRNA (guanine527-N7)-methyltransferase